MHWMSRVPTNSNIADDPSRGDCKFLMSMGVSRTEVNVDLVWNDAQEFQIHGREQRPASKFPTLSKRGEWSTARV